MNLKRLGETIPKVSIGLPVYNGDRYLQNALTRLLQQDYDDLELIVSDNASTDRTQEICLDFARTDSRIRYFRSQKNIGLAANHNRTFKLARGKYFKWAAYDDDFPRAMLSSFVKVLDYSSEDVCLVYSFCEYIDENGRVEEMNSDRVAKNNPWPHKRFAHLLRYIHMYNCNFGLIRSEVLQRSQLLGLYPGSDHVLLSELSMLGMFVEIPEPLLRIRKHQGRSFTANKTLSELKELFNPGQRQRFMFLGLWGRIHLELIRSAILIPMTVRDKIFCTAVAILVPQYWKVRGFAGRYKRKIMERF